jgi:thioester reductase-like protein
LNGQQWQPKDSTGASTYPITYNGTTWLPVKSIGDVLGAQIGWNAAANSVLIDGSTGGFNTTYVFTKDHPEKTLISLIGEAKSTLDIAIYSLTHPDIIQAIKDAKARGQDTSKRQVTNRSIKNIRQCRHTYND